MSTTLINHDPWLPSTGSFSPPAVPETYLSRPRLKALLAAPWHAMQIQAGPGFGKTQLVAQWAHKAHDGAVWLTIESRHNDPAYLSAQLGEAFRRSAVGAVLILDDASNLVEPAAWAILQDIVERRRTVVISRRPTGLHLARLRSMGLVQTISADDLRFTLREAQTLLSTHLQSRMTGDQVRVLWTITRGWAAGLALAFVAERQYAGATTFEARQWRLWDHLVDGYLIEEVLAPMPDDLRHLAISTADLPYLSEDLGLPELDGVTLQRLASWMPQLEVDDLQSRWYRCDPLLTVTLRRQARLAAPLGWPPPNRRQVVARLMASGRDRVAADLASQIGDDDLIVGTLLNLIPRLEDMSYFDEMLIWLDRAPRAQQIQHLDLHHQQPFGHLDFDYWWLLARLALGRTFGVAERLRDVEPDWLDQGDARQLGRLHLIRGMLAFHEGDGTTAVARLQAAQAILPPEAEMEHLYAATVEGRQHGRDGRDDLAAKPLAVAERTLRRQSIYARWGWLTVASDRADTYALRGDLHSAVTKYELMIQELPDEMPDVEGFLRCRLLAIHLERDQLTQAEANLERIDDLLEMERLNWRNGPALARIQAIMSNHRRLDFLNWQHDAEIARIRLLLAQGHADQAEGWGAGYLKQTRHLPHKDQIVLMLAYLWLERREWPMVESWLRDLGTLPWPWAKAFGDINPQLLAIDLDLARGDLSRALRRSSDLVAEAANRLRWSAYVTGSARLALARDLTGDAAGARSALAEAARVGLPGGFVRSFNVPGWDIVNRFGTFWSELGLPVPAGPVVTDHPLTRREMEVLVLVAKGKSNKQIATELFISVNTVRNHLVRMSRRLDVGSRTEVVARARELGLLT